MKLFERMRANHAAAQRRGAITRAIRAIPSPALRQELEVIESR